MSSHPSERPTWTLAGNLRAVLFGLASGGVCPAAASPRRWCALTAPFHPCPPAVHVGRPTSAVCFCGTFPRVSPGRSSTTLPCDVPTFLEDLGLRGCLTCAFNLARPAPPRGEAMTSGASALGAYPDSAPKMSISLHAASWPVQQTASRSPRIPRTERHPAQRRPDVGTEAATAAGRHRPAAGRAAHVPQTLRSSHMPGNGHLSVRAPGAFLPIGGRPRVGRPRGRWTRPRPHADAQSSGLYATDRRPPDRLRPANLSSGATGDASPPAPPENGGAHQRLLSNPTTRPRTLTSLLRIGSMVSFSGCRRMWSASRKKRLTVASSPSRATTISPSRAVP